MTPNDEDFELVFRQRIEEILGTGGGSGRSLQRRAAELGQLRADFPAQAPAIDRALLLMHRQLRDGVEETKTLQAALRSELDKLAEPPWRIGRVAQIVEEEGRPRVAVFCGGAPSLVELSDSVDGTGLVVGDCVYLSAASSMVMGRAPAVLLSGGETALFDRVTPDGRVVLQHRDEEFVVTAAPTLESTSLTAGDRVRWDRAANLALEFVDDVKKSRYLAEPESVAAANQIGGLDASFERLLSTAAAAVISPEKAEAYGLSGRRSILLVGPPGCGKTLLARSVAQRIGEMSERKSHFFVVRPGEWESPWVGETQSNVRTTFESLKAAAATGIAVVFFDEVEAIGRHRGGPASQHADKFTAAFLAELDGFAGRGNVCIISASNRKDLIDSALLQRLSDVEIRVSRPDAEAARSIVGIHLSESIPVRPNGSAARHTREEILDAAVARLYATNGDADLCTLHFRDGRVRRIGAGELVSGRLLEQICRGASEQAFVRDVGGGERGVGVADMDRAVSDAMEMLTTTLTIHNAREYLEDLPQDVYVVRVEPVVRRVKRRMRYINAH
jgi:proteasome-associated ATPase